MITGLRGEQEALKGGQVMTAAPMSAAQLGVLAKAFRDMGLSTPAEGIDELIREGKSAYVETITTGDGKILGARVNNRVVVGDEALWEKRDLSTIEAGARREYGYKVGQETALAFATAAEGNSAVVRRMADDALKYGETAQVQQAVATVGAIEQFFRHSGEIMSAGEGSATGRLRFSSKDQIAGWIFKAATGVSASGRLKPPRSTVKWTGISSGSNITKTYMAYLQDLRKYPGGKPTLSLAQALP